jgi:hypothetical protein
MTETDTQREMVSEADIRTMLEAFAGSAEPLPGAARRRHQMTRRTRSLVTAIVLAAVVATPALAFSTTVRELVGLNGSSPPALQATVTGTVIHKKPRFGLAKVTVTFTIGEPGKPPGSGITFGSHFQILLLNRAGRPSSFRLGAADGKHGRYSATTILPTGGIEGIKIGGFLNYPTGGSTAKNAVDFWIPVTTKRKHCNAGIPCPL